MKKINIAICDNNRYVIENISKMIDEFSDLRHFDINYSTFTNYEQLINKIDQFDLFILDYKMDDDFDDKSEKKDKSKINGMDFARQIRQNSNKSKGIIFITAYPEFVYESFEVRTYRFLVKPVKKEMLFNAIDSFIKNNIESHKILVNINKEIHVIDADTILYLEVSRKNTFIYLDNINEVVKCRKTISEFEEMLKPIGFYRVHRSYLVNTNKIKQFDTRTLTLKNGEKIFISQKCYPGLCELYLQTKNNII